MSGPVGIVVIAGGCVLLAVADVVVAKLLAVVDARRTRKALGR